MKICALTMVYRDHWALSQWYMHYGTLLGAKNLYIIAHGRDDRIAEICPQATIITIERDNLDRFDWSRGEVLNDYQVSLTEEYDWVIRTDADELVCLDPAYYPTFESLFSKPWGPAIFGLGLEVAEELGDHPVPMNVPVLSKRSAAVFSGHYSKAWAVNSSTRLVRHGMKVGKRQANRVDFSMPEGVYIAHLKYADIVALVEANSHRIQVGNTKGKAMPGAAWQDPEKADDKFFRKFVSFPVVPWEDARKEAFDEISMEPIREAGRGIVRAKSARFQKTTRLPDWFKAFGQSKTT
jgi:hypothetical protein